MENDAKARYKEQHRQYRIAKKQEEYKDKKLEAFLNDEINNLKNEIDHLKLKNAIDYNEGVIKKNIYFSIIPLLLLINYFFVFNHYWYRSIVAILMAFQLISIFLFFMSILNSPLNYYYHYDISENFSILKRKIIKKSNIVFLLLTLLIITMDTLSIYFYFRSSFILAFFINFTVSILFLAISFLYNISLSPISDSEN